MSLTAGEWTRIINEKFEEIVNLRRQLAEAQQAREQAEQTLKIFQRDLGIATFGMPSHEPTETEDEDRLDWLCSQIAIVTDERIAANALLRRAQEALEPTWDGLARPSADIRAAIAAHLRPGKTEP